MNSDLPRSQPEKSDLFRAEILLLHGNRSVGQLKLSRPISARITAAFAIFVGVLLLSYLVLGTLDRKTKTIGVLVPVSGNLLITTPRAGVITKSLVVEGQRVKRTDPLFEVSTTRVIGRGELSELVGEQLSVKRDILASDKESKAIQYAERTRTLTERAKNVRKQITQSDNELAILDSRIALAEETTKKFDELAASGFVSAIQLRQRKDELLAFLAARINLTRTKTELESSHISLLAEMTEFESQHRIDVDRFRLLTSELQVQVSENQDRKSTWLTAPVDGKVSAIAYSAGQSVAAGTSIATMIPFGSSSGAYNEDLELHLFVQSRAIGFLSPGQSVLLRYQAFPYQKFGFGQGIVQSITETPFAPNDMPAGLLGSISGNMQRLKADYVLNESLYRVKVRLSSQKIKTQGVDKALKAGMLVEADIIQEKRRLWEWVFEPLLSLKGR